MLAWTQLLSIANHAQSVVSSSSAQGANFVDVVNTSYHLCRAIQRSKIKHRLSAWGCMVSMQRWYKRWVCLDEGGCSLIRHAKDSSSIQFHSSHAHQMSSIYIRMSLKWVTKLDHTCCHRRHMMHLWNRSASVVAIYDDDESFAFLVVCKYFITASKLSSAITVRIWPYHELRT